MSKRAPVIPPNVNPNNMLRLEVAAALGFPDLSVSVAALRREAAAGNLAIYAIAGKHFTTLNDIEEMKTKCRVPAKAPDFGSDRVEPTEQPSTSSSTEERKLALAAAKATLAEPSANSKTTFARSTTRRKQFAKVIPIR